MKTFEVGTMSDEGYERGESPSVAEVRGVH